MNIAFYVNYGYYLNTQAALAKLKAHDIDRVVCWLGRDVDSVSTVTEYELMGYVKDNRLAVDAAILPNDQLAYLSNTRYGRKDAIKAYKQYVLSAVEHGVPMLITDAAKVCDAEIEAFKEICDFATEQGILVAVRDCADVDTIGLLSQVDNLYYCLDTAACAKNAIAVPQRLTAIDGRLVYVLIADVGHDDTRHLPQEADFAPIKNALNSTGYAGSCAIYATAAKGIADADAFVEAAKALVK